MRAFQLLPLAALALPGCSNLNYKPMTYTNVSDMQPSPGLFTGREGAFVLFHSDKPLDLTRGASTDATPETGN